MKTPISWSPVPSASLVESEETPEKIEEDADAPELVAEVTSKWYTFLNSCPAHTIGTPPVNFL